MSSPRGSGLPFRLLTRVGFATKGMVYLLMGGLTLLAAAGQRGGQVGDKRRSMQALQTLPGGHVLLAMIAIGLAGYALLRVLQGVLDTEEKGHHAKGVVRRFGYVVNGIIYIGLITYAAHGALHARPGESARDAEQTWSARMLRFPGGAWLILFIGAVTVGAGLYTFYQAWRSQFLETIDLDGLGEKRRLFARRAGQIGYSARGVVMMILGGFFIHAGKTGRATDVGSTQDALDLLQKMGPGVLGVVAAGLFAYGVYALIQAAYPVRR